MSALARQSEGDRRSRVSAGRVAGLGLIRGRSRDTVRQPERRLIPELVRLESRRLLSTFDVTSTADDGSAGTLRWAVAQANAASSSSTIDFQLTTPATITLTQGQLELTNTAAAITIDGPGASLLSVSGNKASRVFQVDKGVTASISGLTITGGSTAASGGGLENYGAITLADCTISNSSVTGNYSHGGGLQNSGTAVLTDCTISGNSADQQGDKGGGLESIGTVTLTRCTISGNSADSGGGLAADGTGTATLTDCTISGNSATGIGGGLDNRNTATVTGCTISGNSAGGSGGGVLNEGLSEAALTMSDCTISGNAARYGGGMDNGQSATVTDCTISDNSASATAAAWKTMSQPSSPIARSAAMTAAIGAAAYGPITSYAITSCTISGNSAKTGGALYNGTFNNIETGKSGNGTVTLTDTIVAGNATGGTPSDLGGKAAAEVTGSYNLVGTGGSGGLTDGTNGNIVLTSPTDLGLGPLADNGGPTETMALLPGSPAIKAGTAASGVSTDQRGQRLDSPPDIGAYQIPSSQPIVLSFTGLNSTSITFGTPNVTISGTLANGTQAPQGETITITLNGVSHQATIGAGGAFSTTFDTSTHGVSGSPYAVSYSYAGDATYGTATDTSTLTINKAMPTVTVSDAGGTFTGKAFPAATTVAGVGGTASSSIEGATPTLTYYAGTSATGTPLSGPPSQGGTYTVVASFPGSADYKPIQSAVTFTINPAVASIALTPSTTSTAYGQSMTFVATVTGPGATPGGTVTFSDGGTVLGTAPVDTSGQATLITAALPRAMRQSPPVTAAMPTSPRLPRDPSPSRLCKPAPSQSFRRLKRSSRRIAWSPSACRCSSDRPLPVRSRPQGRPRSSRSSR